MWEGHIRNAKVFPLCAILQFRYFRKIIIIPDEAIFGEPMGTLHNPDLVENLLHKGVCRVEFVRFTKM